MGITYKEYVWLIKPEDVNEILDGGVIGCPCDYGISYEDCINCSDYMSCGDCMNQEIPYPVIAEVVEDGDAGFRYRKGEKFKLASCEINGDIEIYHADSSDGIYFISDHLEDFKFYIDKEKEISLEEALAVLKEHYGCDVKIKE